jgi:ketosteroid isomerase-like protein
VSEAEVERLANSFAAAYADENSARIGRIITSDAQRVQPDNRQEGRADVVAAYDEQFASNTITDFELSNLEIEGGPVGRATATYRTGSTTGTITFDVIREKGKPRIMLVSTVPDA